MDGFMENHRVSMDDLGLSTARKSRKSRHWGTVIPQNILNIPNHHLGIESSSLNHPEWRTTNGSKLANSKEEASRSK